MIVLFIDDDPSTMDAYRFDVKYFVKPTNDTDVGFAPCHSAEEALQAIEAAQPKVVFLDHALSPDGNEGLRVVDALIERNSLPTVYATTVHERFYPGYLDRGAQIASRADRDQIIDLVRQAIAL